MEESPVEEEAPTSAPEEAPAAASKGGRGGVAGSREEIDRIRRILDDLD